nr:3-hydroxybutyryl-CoA dehydrogenase [Parafrankia elaeagni]
MRRVGIVGCGTMGAAVAELCALAGLDVRVVVSPRDVSAAAGRRRITDSLDRGVQKGRLTTADRDAALAAIELTTRLDDLADRQLVIEAIHEDEGAKVDLLSALDRIVEDPDAILASNTSSIPIVRLGRCTRRARNVIGLHFFNPVSVLPLVEVVSSVLTSEDVRDRAEHFVATVLGKEPIHSPDRAGFLVNALLIPYLLAAIRMVESGLATPAVIDQGMTSGCSHPMGPLRLADLIGLDVTAAIADALYDEFKEPLYAPPPLLQRMVEGGLLGRKRGRGFYVYS